MYGYLFYKSYQGALRSNNWADWPQLGACFTVSWCVSLNMLSFGTVLERVFGYEHSSWYRPELKWVFTLTIILSVASFFLFNKRYLKYIEKYDKIDFLRNFSVFATIAFHYIFSFFLVILAVKFRDHGWIFK